MIIDPRRAARSLATLAVVAGLWFGGITAATLVFEPTEAVVVFSPQTEIAHRLPDDVFLLDRRGDWLFLTSDEPGHVAALYRAGAWLVWPSRRRACMAVD